MSSNMAVVYAVDDDPHIGESIDHLVQTVGLRAEKYLSGETFLSGFNPSAVSCLVLDLRMPDLSGPEIVARLQKSGHQPPTIYLSGYADPQIVARVFRDGAFDFIEKPLGAQYLLDRIRAALKQVEQSRAQAERVREIAARRGRLSPRESTVLDYVVNGYSNKRIAEVLGLSSKTVEVHRSHAMRKMRADSLAELVRQALALEWFADSPSVARAAGPPVRHEPVLSNAGQLLPARNLPRATEDRPLRTEPQTAYAGAR